MNESDRIDKIEREQGTMWSKINEMDKKLEITNYRTDQILSIVQKLEETVNELKEKPAKSWDKARDVIVGSILTGVVGLILGLIFAKIN